MDSDISSNLVAASTGVQQQGSGMLSSGLLILYTNDLIRLGEAVAATG